MKIVCVTFDYAEGEDPAPLVAFWCAALGFEPRGHWCMPPDGVGPYLEFSPAPESKIVKNRVHLGLHVADGERLDAEVARLQALGATIAWEEDFPDDFPERNLVLRDPAGNEFCLGGPK